MLEYGFWERDWGETTEKADWIGWDEVNPEPIWFETKFEVFVLNSLDFPYIVSLKLLGVPLLKSLDSWLIIPSWIFDSTLFPGKADCGIVLLVLSRKLSEEFWLKLPPKGTDEENCLGGPVSSTLKLAGEYDCEVFTCGPLEKLLILLG